MAIERSKDGVPQWDGAAHTFQEYSEAAEHWEQTIPYHKRYLCGPRLLNELSGTARRYVMSKRPGWISHDGGVQTLLAHLRRQLGLPQLAEMSSYMNQYFKQSRRKKNESVNDYITRKSELYARTEQTLQRAQAHYDHRGQPVPPTQKTWGVAEEMEYQNALEEPPHTESSLAEPATGGDAAGDSGTSPQLSQAGQWEEDAWATWRQWRQPWGNQSGDWWGSSWSNYRNSSTRSEETSKTRVLLLPDFVQGWFLLQDSNLETNERNMILAALKGDFSLHRVAQELRNQWTDEDLRRRDQQGRASAWVADDSPDDPFAADSESPDLGMLISSGLNAEGMALVTEAEDEAQEAMALMEKGRRTLREARARQQFVRLSRQYYGQASKTQLRGNPAWEKGDQHPSRPRKMPGLWRCSQDR